MATRYKTRARPQPAKATSARYALVFFVLAILTGLEVFIATMANVPKVPFLLGMSFVKAMLVILYFMHLRYDSRWFGLIFFLPFLLIVPLLMVLPH